MKTQVKLSSSLFSKSWWVKFSKQKDVISVGGPSTSTAFESSGRTPVFTMNQQVVAHHQKKLIIVRSSCQVNTRGEKRKLKSMGTQTFDFSDSVTCQRVISDVIPSSWRLKWAHGDTTQDAQKNKTLNKLRLVKKMKHFFYFSTAIFFIHATTLKIKF